ncbi:hypothetical protein BDD12DRAFT_880452 [Trichophaea hybrida]|nr:hypothetical protein BDD12DRAFT_880452 [Trichophaea hybrida]
MSSDFDFEQPSLPNRRLSLRNSRFSAPQIPLSSGYNSRRRRSSSGGGLSPLRNKRTIELEGDEQEWESEVESTIGGSGGSLLSVDSSSSRRTRAPSPSYLYAPPHHNAGYHHRRGRSSDGSGKYIEYLEKQVADLTGQLQNYTSATESTSHAAKMRKLAAENRTMRQDIAEWETQFEERVLGEVAERRVLDESLRETVNELENRLEDAECQLRLANAEAKGLRKRCDQMKGIEEENKRLEFKIETLTELLADSTKTIQRCSSAEYSRPSNVAYRRHTTMGGSAPASAPMSRRVSRESGSFRGMEDYGITDPVDMIFAVEQKLDGRTSPSVSSQASSNYSSRRRLSFAAGIQPSRSPVPGQMSPTLRARRMRKFAAGSTAKTLILPSVSVVVSPPTSPPGSPTRPKSASSDLGIGDRERPNFDTMRSVSYPNTHRNSLFAELARVESESEESDEDNDDNNNDGDTTPPTDNSPQKEDTTTQASTAPSTPEMKPTVVVTGAYPETPTFDYDLVSDAISNPPLLIKVFDTVGEGLSSPTRTFFMAKRKAIDIVGNVVGRGVDRVSQHRTKVLAKRSRRSVGSGGIFSDPPPPSLRNRKVRAPPPQAICAECGARKAEAEDSAPVRNTLSRDGTAWKRSTAVGGLRKRSGSMVQPVEDGMEVVWLWFRFIIAVVVALGLAVKDGPPQSVIALNDEEGIDHVREEERARALKRLEGKR